MSTFPLLLSEYNFSNIVGEIKSSLSTMPIYSPVAALKP